MPRHLPLQGRAKDTDAPHSLPPWGKGNQKWWMGFPKTGMPRDSQTNCTASQDAPRVAALRGKTTWSAWSGRKRQRNSSGQQMAMKPQSQKSKLAWNKKAIIRLVLILAIFATKQNRAEESPYSAFCRSVAWYTHPPHLPVRSNPFFWAHRKKIIRIKPASPTAMILFR